MKPVNLDKTAKKKYDCKNFKRGSIMKTFFTCCCNKIKIETYSLIKK